MQISSISVFHPFSRCLTGKLKIIKKIIIIMIAAEESMHTVNREIKLPLIYF